VFFILFITICQLISRKFHYALIILRFFSKKSRIFFRKKSFRNFFRFTTILFFEKIFEYYFRNFFRFHVYTFRKNFRIFFSKTSFRKSLQFEHLYHFIFCDLSALITFLVFLEVVILLWQQRNRLSLPMKRKLH